MDNQIFTPQLTEDGSFTFFSPEFGEQFHSKAGARLEAEQKFIVPCLLLEIAKIRNILTIIDVCYGLGYNTAAALAGIWSVNPDCRVEVIALELNRDVPCGAIAHQLLSGWQAPIPQLLTELSEKLTLEKRYFQGQLLLGDARQTIQGLVHNQIQADAIFLDPFSPPKCPQLWTVEFLNLVAQCLKPDGRLATYSCAASVRSALLLAGLKLGATVNIGRRSPGTVASFNSQNLTPLSPQEQEHLQTRAAIPYRDSNLNDTADMIRKRRELEQQQSNLEPTSHWKKRWSLITV